MRGTALLLAGLLSGCANTMSGEILSWPADAAKEGDVITTVGTVILVPCLLPFALVADTFTVLGGGDFDKGLQTVADAAQVMQEVQQQQAAPQQAAQQQAAQQQAAQQQAQAQQVAMLSQQSTQQPQAQSVPTSQTTPQPAYSQPQSPSAPQADPANTPNAQQVQREYAAHMQQVEQRDAANAAVSHCIEPSSVTSYGGFINKCGFKVDFVYCTTGSTGEGLSNFSDAMDCRNPRGFGSSVVAANGSQANLTAGAKGVYWAACREPYHPTEYRFSGSGITFRCIK